MRTGASPAVAELQGLYGPFAFSELLLQKLWWRREFAVHEAQTVDGRRLRLHAAGRWNRLGGPDFRDAVIEVDGIKQRGDVEVHLRAEDWEAHRHAHDPAYDRVILHVVLFPSQCRTTRGAAGDIPILVLLPLLWYDLEEYATDEAIAASLNRAEHRIAVELAALPPDCLMRLMWTGGRRRWEEKVRFAQHRVEKLGWEPACHQSALEVLGYRANRAPMLQVAAQWPLESWRRSVDADAVWAELNGRWALQGVRPANHPRLRLRQYANWVQRLPRWPDVASAWAERLPTSPDATEPPVIAQERQQLGFPAAWLELKEQTGADAIGPSRANNLFGDALLPLLAAQHPGQATTLQRWWWSGYVGDLPNPVRRALRELGLAGSRALPAAIGTSQGLLGWLLQKEDEDRARGDVTAG